MNSILLRTTCLLAAVAGGANATHAQSYLNPYNLTIPKITQNLPNGTSGAPALAFANFPSVGFYYDTVHNLIASSGVVEAPGFFVGNGTAGAPAVGFTSSSNTGIFYDSANSALAFSVGGTQAFETTASVLTSAVELKAPGIQAGNGTAAGPAFGFSNAASSGFYLDSVTPGVAFSVNGTYAGEFNSSGLAVSNLVSAGGYKAGNGTTASPSYTFSASGNTGIYYDSGNTALAFSVGGNQIGEFRSNEFLTTSIINTPGVAIGGGSVYAPAIYFSSYPQNGFYDENGAGAYGFTIANTLNGTVTQSSSSPSIFFGGHSYYSFPFNSVIVNDSSLNARGSAIGCQDMGVVFSAIQQSSIFTGDFGIVVNSGINGGCSTAGLPGIAQSGFDSTAEFVQSDNNAPPLTLTGITYTTTGATFTGGATASQIRRLQPWTYVLTNSIGSGNPGLGGVPALYGSYLVSATSTAPDPCSGSGCSGGGTLTVIGWVVTNSNSINPNPTASIPSTNYLTGSVSPLNQPYIWVGQPTGVLTRNEECSLASNQYMVTNNGCTEIDVNNFTGTDLSAVNAQRLSGLGITSGGGNKAGVGLQIGGITGPSNGFLENISLPNIGSIGIFITQTGGSSNNAVGIQFAGLEQSTNIQAITEINTNNVIEFSLGPTGLITTTGGMNLTGGASLDTLTLTALSTSSGGKCLGYNTTTHVIYVSGTTC